MVYVKWLYYFKLIILIRCQVNVEVKVFSWHYHNNAMNAVIKYLTFSLVIVCVYLYVVIKTCQHSRDLIVIWHDLDIT